MENKKVYIHPDIIDYANDKVNELESIYKRIEEIRSMLCLLTVIECENAADNLYDAGEHLWKAKVELEKVKEKYERG